MACNCNKRAIALVRKLGFVRTSEAPSCLRYKTDSVRLDIEIPALKRHHFRLATLAMVAKILGG